MIKVIIVDDSRIFRKMLKAVFVENGDEVIGEAGNGQELLDMLENCTPDLITLDITMPVMDGIEALKQLLDYDSDAKIIMITAAGQQAKLIDALKIGAKKFITKPFEKEEIIKNVEEVIKE